MEENIFTILEELSVYNKKIGKISMMEVFDMIRDPSYFGGLNNDENKIETQYRYFCGYRAYSDLSDYEYERVNKLIDFLRERSEFLNVENPKYSIKLRA